MAENEMVERVRSAIEGELRKRQPDELIAPYVERAARAAIEAMRPATYAMRFGQGEAWPEDAAKLWNRMLDAALSPEAGK